MVFDGRLGDVRGSLERAGRIIGDYQMANMLNKGCVLRAAAIRIDGKYSSPVAECLALREGLEKLVGVVLLIGQLIRIVSV
ncbi:hypothetical protein L484_011319 [Morus notabilis]|uniref:Uncharacterized protein n=1 Tax=Morus notabilis TaxID=981085 RepID=W9QMM4_9ROSA|nr:hypothetical protein L484_011319 [Morus notabilis]